LDRKVVVQIISLVYGGVEGAELDTAHAGIVTGDGKTDVAAFSP